MGWSAEGSCVTICQSVRGALDNELSVGYVDHFSYETLRGSLTSDQGVRGSYIPDDPTSLDLEDVRHLRIDVSVLSGPASAWPVHVSACWSPQIALCLEIST